MSLCTECNTELLDNLIQCAGRCYKYFHYTCVGISRTIFDGYKKVPGLKWQCSACMDEFNHLSRKLDDLTALVNEMKSSINLYGLVKSTIVDVFKDGLPSENSLVSAARVTPVNNKAKKKKKKQQQQRRSDTDSQPKQRHPPLSIESPSSNDSQAPDSRIESTPYRFDDDRDPVHDTSSGTNDENLDETIIDRANVTTRTQCSEYGIRVAEKRSYLWLGGFHHTSTCQQVISLVAKVLEINENDIICRSLKSGRRKYNDFNQVSFRIGLKSTDVKDALQPNKWPEGVACKYFKRKN